MFLKNLYKQVSSVLIIATLIPTTYALADSQSDARFEGAKLRERQSPRPENPPPRDNNFVKPTPDHESPRPGNDSNTGGISFERAKEIEREERDQLERERARQVERNERDRLDREQRQREQAQRDREDRDRRDEENRRQEEFAHQDRIRQQQEQDRIVREQQQAEAQRIRNQELQDQLAAQRAELARQAAELEAQREERAREARRGEASVVFKDVTRKTNGEWLRVTLTNPMVVSQLHIYVLKSSVEIHEAYVHTANGEKYPIYGLDNTGSVDSDLQADLDHNGDRIVAIDIRAESMGAKATLKVSVKTENGMPTLKKTRFVRK